MTPQEALDSIRANISNKNRLKHMVAVGAVVQASARRFGEDEKERKLPKYFTGVSRVVSQDMWLTVRGGLIYYIVEEIRSYSPWKN